MTPATHRSLAPAPAGPDSPLGALRREIDTLDDALHDLLMRRAEVVARLATSRTKGEGSPLRPGREAQILRRLLARHAGPLPQAALVRLWREVLATSSAMQNRFAVAAHGTKIDALAREHFGSLTPVESHAGPAAALAAVASGEAHVAVLPLPAEGEPAEAAWWVGLDAPRLQVVARLPFWSAAPGPEALAVALGAPDPSGEDRSLLRLEWRDGAGLDRDRIGAALAAAGLPARSLLPHWQGGALRALAETEGVLEAGDPRLARLPVDGARPLGFYAVPFRGPQTEE
jgi:chorismate mutase / prephenate dehydratase